jgi:hypothetical protein
MFIHPAGLHCTAPTGSISLPSCLSFAIHTSQRTLWINSTRIHIANFQTKTAWPPLWPSGQSSWLQFQRHTFHSRRYQIFWEVVGLERGPLRLVSTVEVLLGRKRSCSSIENRDYGRKVSAALTTRHPSIHKIDEKLRLLGLRVC